MKLYTAIKIFTITTIIFSSISCSKEPNIHENHVLFPDIDITLRVGDKITIHSTVPMDYSIDNDNRTVIWFSSDPKIVTVDYDGDITAVSVGKTNIIVIGRVSGSIGICHVTVLDKI